MSYASVAEVRRDVAALFRPARRLAPTDATMRSLIDYRNGQHYDIEAAPYMREPLDLMASREHEATILIGPSRSSKSFSLVMGGLTYIITCDPADTSVIHMNQSESRQFSKAEFARTMQASPDLGKELGAAAGDDNIEMKLMRNGMALRMAFPSIGCVSSKTIRWIFITDADNLTGDLKLPDLFPLAQKRAQTFLSAGHCIVEGNPAVDHDDPNWTPKTPHEGPPASGLVSLYNSGDRRRFYWFCPHCGEPMHVRPGLAPFAMLASRSMEELKEIACSDKTAIHAAQMSRVICKANGCEIDHDHKREMNLRGVWLREGQSVDRSRNITGDGVVSRRGTFWVAGAMAAYQSWSSMVEQYLLAVKHYATTGEDGQIKQKLNTDFAWPHIPLALLDRKANTGLGERSEEQMQDHVPGGVRFLTASVDVQGNRFAVQVLGYGEGLEKWVIDRYALRTSTRSDGKGGFFPLNPAAYLEDWDRLIEKVIERRYPLSDGSGRTMPIRRVHIDSGGKAGPTGKVTERAYQFWRRLKTLNKHHAVRLVKGEPREGAPRIEERYPDTRSRKDRSSGSAGDVPVVFINTTIIKDAISADLARDEPGPGYWHFADWLPQSFYAELTSETRTDKGWENARGARNEELDLAVYNHAAALSLKADKIKWNAPPPWALPWDKNPDVHATDAPPAPAAPIRRRGNRSSGVSAY